MYEYPIIKFFGYEHLHGEAHRVSKQFHDLAVQMAAELPQCPETAIVLRKLLEAKDAAVRATMEDG